MKQILWFIVMCLAVTGCWRSQPYVSPPKRVKLIVPQCVERGSLLRYPGKVQPSHEVSLSFKVSGRIAHVAVRAGDFVRAGDVIAVLDDTDYRLSLDAVGAEYEKVKAEAERVMALYREGAATEAAYEQAYYGLQQVTAKLHHAQEQCAYTRLTAPFGGQIQHRLLDSFEMVSAGTPIVTLIGGDMPEVELHLTAADYVRRASFQQYSCTFDSYPTASYTLRPLSVAPKANANQLYTMRLQCCVEGNQPTPAAGMTTMVTITTTPTGPSCYVLPTGAVWHADARSFIYRRNPQTGCILPQDVVVEQLHADGTCTVRCAESLSDAQVVAAGVHTLHSGERVEPLDTITATNIGGLL